MKITRALLGLLLVFGFHAGAAAPPSPALFYYPPAAIYPGDYRIASPLTFKTEQITNQFPAIPEMSGVALTIYWSVISPRQGEYDFSIIDEALRYWSARGKKVVLCVATVGFPVRMDDDHLMCATPDWVMRKVANVTADIRVIPYNHVPEKNHAVAAVPSYFDPVFMELTRGLVRTLAARYDGNPAIAQVRIATGILGEDNGTFDGIDTKYPGFTKDNWIAYTQKVTDLYCSSFRKSELDFDEGWTAVNQMYGTEEEKKTAQAFVETLYQRHVFIAFNGLCSMDNRIWTNRDNPAALTKWEQTVALDLRMLQQAKARGCHIGLEAIGPITGPQMTSMPDILATIHALQPDRLLWFNDVANLRNVALQNPILPPLGIPGYPPALLSVTVKKVQDLFAGLGYP